MAKAMPSLLETAAVLQTKSFKFASRSRGAALHKPQVLQMTESVREMSMRASYAEAQKAEAAAAEVAAEMDEEQRAMQPAA